eukprot:1973879-Pleurochrysis_carterae.AAC.2
MHSRVKYFRYSTAVIIRQTCFAKQGSLKIRLFRPGACFPKGMFSKLFVRFVRLAESELLAESLALDESALDKIN